MALERIPPPARTTCWLVALAVSIVAAAPQTARAHDVAPDPVVDLAASLDGPSLTLLARVPLAVLTAAGLRLDGTQLALDASQSSLDLVGRDLAANLELSQGERALTPVGIRSTSAADRTAVDVEIAYAIDQSGEPVTARLPPYNLAGVPIRTIVRYERPPAPPRTFTVSAEAERVAFDPAAPQVFRQFVARAASALLGGGDFLIFALCFVVPGRRPRALVGASAALLAGELLTVPVTGAHIVTLTPALAAVVQFLAGSVILVTALLSALNPASRWLAPLTFVFGLAHGLDAGAVFATESGLAGLHTGVALLSFLAVSLFGQLWIVALLSSALGIVLQWGLPRRVALFGLVAVSAHTALHRLASGTQTLATVTGGSADHYGVALVLAWCGVILCAGIADRLWLTHTTDDLGQPDRASSPAAS